MDEEHLTYRQLAERLGVKPDSARKLAQRRRWRRIPGNDGAVRVVVPVEALPVAGEVTPVVAPDASGGVLAVAGDVTRDVALDVPPVDHEAVARELDLRIEGLRALLAAEGRRADAAESDRDRWHALATRPWWRRLAG